MGDGSNDERKPSGTNDWIQVMSGVEARAIVEAAVRRELFGPNAIEERRGRPIDCSSGVVSFATKEESYGRFYDQNTGQEVLSQGDPLHRYGVGVLYPGASVAESESDSGSRPLAELSDDAPIPGLSSQSAEPTEAPPLLSGNLHDDTDTVDSDDFDLADANKFKPSAMAVSFKCRLAQEGGFKIVVQGAYYDKLSVHLPMYANPLYWWVRRPFVLEGLADQSAMLADRRRTPVKMTPADNSPFPRVFPSIELFSRPVPGDLNKSVRLVTIAVSNPTVSAGPESALFQMGFSVEAIGDSAIEPYPEGVHRVHDPEEQSLDLLYRKRLTYGIGHGCAATWDDTQVGPVTVVVAEPMPAYEVPSITPELFVHDESGDRRPVDVSMRDLALGLPEGHAQVELILDLYERWIRNRQKEAEGLPDGYKPTAERHLGLCREALRRMRFGWSMVKPGGDRVATRAFQLMNEAMLYQQLRSRLDLRPVRRKSDDTLEVVGEHPSISPLDTLEVPRGRGNWRPFQIAFILATLPELVERSDPHRAMVDLIFFPTGGGKTEAYLGASALSLLSRRLRNPNDAGTDTLMRYTLRLLTTQQFQRAASLICVLEDMRSKNEAALGASRFGIGIWLGRASTPNTWKQATEALSGMQRRSDAQNQFLLLKCPWCGAQMGPQKQARSKAHIDIPGYVQVGKKVSLRCVDRQCRFAGQVGPDSRRAELPVHVVDEDIYDTRPSIIIGTVDKFAMLAWQPKAQALFGIGPDGSRAVSPPGLIVQDELHLISGPLGSMVGLYEPVIDDLCTDKRGTSPIVPKIVASTATARRYEEQILGLFGRGLGQVAIFPPHGLEEGRSFFAEPETLPDGTRAPGRRYLGVFSASLGSMQTVQVRVAAATLQVARNLPTNDRDGYWTNLNFLNSLRELGNTVSLLQSDVPDYLTGLRHRDGLLDPRWPRPFGTMELTSRRRNDEIPKAIERLQLAWDDPQSVDICLASNIIEVGIDIDRLGLMTIVGQPKTTAQYIQVSGRVGRQPSVSPGLVITIYGAAKPRDRSHFERFQTYHQRLYAQVEPTSVTPFSVPVLRRALHGAIVACIRQSSRAILEPNPFPRAEFDEAARLLRERAVIADPPTLGDVDSEIKRRARQWGSWERTNWSANAFDGDPNQGLMRFAGTLPALNSKATVWDIPTSMRNVDAECSLQITLAYAQEDGARIEGDGE